MLTGTELGKAIDEAIRMKGVTKRSVAAHFGVAPPSVQDWVKRGTIDKAKLPALWDFFRDVVGPEHWGLEALPTTAGQTGRPVLVIHDGEPLPDGVVYIPESEIRLSGGPGQVAYTDTPGSIAIPYMADWLTKAGIPHGKGRRFKIRGESMEDTLFDGDTVLVNTADKDVVDGKVYAFTWDGDFRVKRLFRRISGGLVIHSDNPRFLPRDEEFTAEEVDEHIYIIGRVKDKSGSGGL